MNKYSQIKKLKKNTNMKVIHLYYHKVEMINYHDIPAPTEDDMLRITKDIYPDNCKNPYNPLPD